MRALITGITGFAGSHLAEHLLECNDQVFGCSQRAEFSSELADRLRDVPLFACNFLQDPLPGLRQAAAFEPDWICHLAALSVPADCGREEPTDAARAVNVDGTRAVIDFALSLPKRPRLLLVSSSYVYGAVEPSQPVVSEEAACQPQHGYGKTKLLAEQLVLDASRQQGLDTVIARSFQHAGPRQSARMMLSEWSSQLARAPAGPVRVLCLDSHLDLTDVRDVVRAYRLLLLQGRAGTIYNVGSGICRRSGDIFQQLMELAGSDAPVIETSPGRRQQPIADISRLTRQTAWQPEIALTQTLQDTLTYWQERQDRQQQTEP